MESVLALAVGLMAAAALYLMLSGVLVRFVFGLTLMGNAINLLIFSAGRLTYKNPPLISKGQEVLAAESANALPQALILTAIVIGFAMTVFFMILLYRTYDQTLDLDADREPFLSELTDAETTRSGEPESEREQRKES